MASPALALIRNNECEGVELPEDFARNGRLNWIPRWMGGDTNEGDQALNKLSGGKGPCVYSVYYGYRFAQAREDFAMIEEALDAAADLERRGAKEVYVVDSDGLPVTRKGLSGS
jgi:hypothetical protein